MCGQMADAGKKYLFDFKADFCNRPGFAILMRK
jgi:hypothetical protein